MRQLSFMCLILVGLSACAVVQRHADSGYPTGNSEEPTYDYESVRALSPEEREKYEERIMLDRLERQLRLTDERRQYERYKETLESDRERIEFLSLDGAVARERYLQSKGYTTSPNRHNRQIASLIESNDIAVGMFKQAVRESWGDPLAIEYSGKPDGGNERWRYIEYVSTPEGYTEEQRVLYFENGVLVGWEKY